MVQPETALVARPGIAVRRQRRQRHRVVGAADLAVQAQGGTGPGREAVARHELVVGGAGSGIDRQPLGFARGFGDDIDHAIDGIGAIQRPARPADHFDARHIGQRHIDILPEHAGGKRRIHAASVHQNQKLVGGFRRVKAARADRVGKAVDARDFQIGRQPQGFGQVDRAGAANVLARNHVNGRRGLGQQLGSARHGCDLDLGKLLDGQGGQVGGAGRHLLGANRRDQQKTSQHTQTHT